MKEVDSYWCDVGNRKVFKLQISKGTDQRFVGKFYLVENFYMRQISDLDPCPRMKFGKEEEIAGSDVEQITEKAKARILALGYKFSSWRK